MNLSLAFDVATYILPEIVNQDIDWQGVVNSNTTLPCAVDYSVYTLR